MAEKPSQMIDLANLTPEMIEQLKGVLGTTGGVTRTPAWKPLKDLRAPQTAKGRLNRPHFEWSADDDGNTWIPPFPRLYWDKNGVEQLIATEADLVRVKTDWTDAPPMPVAIDNGERLRLEFESLSPEDQVFVLEAQKQSRLKKIHDLMSGLSQTDLAALTASQKPVEVKKEKEKKTA